MLLWEQEDQARRPDVPDSDIAANKRAIDRYNQARNDAIEALDELILAPMAPCSPKPDAWMSSETAGSMIDRLSINSLKIHHMRLQARRDDASPEHRLACQAKVERLRQQRNDLRYCLQQLLNGMREGRCFFKSYRQFKMYNDPALNPYLYARAAPEATNAGGD